MWPFTRKTSISAEVETGDISPKVSAELQKIVNDAAKLLVSSKGEEIFRLQRQEIFQANELIKKMQNQIQNINQFSLQTAEWVVAMTKHIRELSEHAKLTSQFTDKLAEYDKQHKALQALTAQKEQVASGKFVSRKEQERWARTEPIRKRKKAEAIEALKSINYELEKMMTDAKNLYGQARNLLTVKAKTKGQLGGGGIPLLIQTANGISDNAGTLQGVATEIVNYSKTIKGLYPNVIRDMKPLIQDLETASKDTKTAIAKLSQG